MKIKIGNKMFEVSDEVITKAQEEKTDVTIEGEFIVRDKTEDETFATNLRSEAKTAGVEIAVKEARRAMGLEFEGKTIENLIEAVKTQTLADAKIEPEEKLKNATKDIETLKATIQTLSSEKESISKEYGMFKNDITINSKLGSLLPDNINLPKEDMMLIVKSKMQFGTDENGNVFAKNQNGEIIKDPSTLNPVDPSTVVKSFFESNPIYLKGASGGAGGDDSSQGKGKITVEKFIEQKSKDGVSHTSPEFIKELEQLQKDGLIEE